MEDVGNGLKKHGFWEFNIGHLILIIMAMGGLLVWWANFSTLPRETAQGLAVLAQTVDKINDKDTLAGQLNSQRQLGINNSFDARILALEKNSIIQTEKLTDVQTKLNVIAALLEKGKK